MTASVNSFTWNFLGLFCFSLLVVVFVLVLIVFISIFLDRKSVV